jgi:polyribonucleotide nucleotidyltransferase
MFKEIIKTTEWGGKTLKLSTGKIARQSDGAVMVEMGDSVVMCTAVSAKTVKEGINFFPLTVHYREMAFAVGKIPGGFFKREGKSSEREVLVSRLIDRPIRPLFHPGFFNETQVICTVLSYDPTCPTDVMAIIGASAALEISGVPYQEIVAASKVGLIDGKFILNPSFEQLKNSKLDLVVAGTKNSVMMVESEADLLSEEQMLDAVKFGHEAFQPVISLIKDLAKEAGKDKWATSDLYPATLKKEIEEHYFLQINEAFSISSKQDRVEALAKIKAEVIGQFTSDTRAEKFSALQVETALEEAQAEVLRTSALDKKIRIDGRKLDEIRPIDCAVSILPKTHGSSLFTRGETQGLVVTTLGTASDEQIIDGLDGDYKENFMLNYIFPPYSVGEATPLKAPGRREIGHGKLAWRAISPVLPTKSEFPYTLRVVSEITESNGSSSMATVCGASMSLMDAGVPIKAMISGIAMGLIKEDDKFVVLSDILGDEDHLGDMDFKVAGGKSGITALQMDIKVTGITFEIMKQALHQAKDGRMHILSQMEKAISEPNKVLSDNAPMIESFKIDKNKIREVIGSGGKVIKEICETTGAKIDITDEGMVSVAAVGRDKLNAAIQKIRDIAFDPEVGGIFDGKVVKILESGAFVNFFGNKDGFVHISEISESRIESVDKVLTEGDMVKVKLVAFDHKGKAKLTMKGLNNSTGHNETSGNEEDSREHAEKPQEKRRSAKKWQGNQSNGSQDEGGAIKERKYFN